MGPMRRKAAVVGGLAMALAALLGAGGGAAAAVSAPTQSPVALLGYEAPPGSGVTYAEHTESGGWQTA